VNYLDPRFLNFRVVLIWWVFWEVSSFVLLWPLGFGLELKQNRSFFAFSFFFWTQDSVCFDLFLFNILMLPLLCCIFLLN
jgi:hypothetical protein